MKMVSVLTRKAIFDVTRRKGRTILIVLGIFISVLGLTAVNSANDIFSKDLSNAVSSSFDVCFAVESAPSSLITKLDHANNVAALELRTVYATTWHLAGNTGGTTPFHIYGYQDLQHAQVGTLQLTSGRLPGPGEIAMDTSDQQYSPIALNDTVTINAPSGQTVTLHVVGLIRSEGMATLSSSAQGYMNVGDLQHIAPESNSTVQAGPPVHTQQILIKTLNRNDNELTFYALSSVVNATHATLLSPTGFVNAQTVQGSQTTLNGLSTIFLALAGLALLLSCLMILTTMNNMLAEQFKIIGTMKAIGGTRGKIIRSYLLSVSIYALIGTALGLGLGLLLSLQISNIVAQQVKLDLGPYQPALWVILISLATGLLAPMLAALIPLWTGTRITVRQAMASYGISTGKSRSAHARGQNLSGLSQIARLGLRGIFRKPGRALLTILALMLSAMVFATANISNTSIYATSAVHHFVASDFQVSLGPVPLPYQQISAKLLALPNMALVEPLDHENVTIADHQARIQGVPATTHLYQPQLAAGRWLQEGELNTLVIGDIAAQRLNKHVGDTITLTQGTRKVSWQVVGILHDTSDASGTIDPHGRPGIMFTTLNNLDITLRKVPDNTASLLYLKAHDNSSAALQKLYGEIQQVLNQNGLWQATVTYAASGFDLTVIIEALFYTVAIVVALVGLLGLSNTLAAEVLERRQEVGILRSLGATGWHVSLVFWLEGLTLALIAWVLGTLLGFPAAYAQVNILNTVNGPTLFSVNFLVIPLTLLFILIVSFIASFGPALNASRVRIREILRYE